MRGGCISTELKSDTSIVPRTAVYCPSTEIEVDDYVFTGIVTVGTRRDIPTVAHMPASGG
jgi:hypothetical protein